MRRFIFLWILLALAAVFVVYFPGLSRYLKFKEKERELDRQILKLEKEIQSLRDEEHLLKTDAGRLEEVIREELGLVRPGEVVYKVVEEQLPEKTPRT